MNITNWDSLRFFLAAAETGSISSAARSLTSNPATVSRHIDALEQGLGEKLFKRSAKGLSLSSRGQYVFEQAQKILQSIHKIQQPSEGNQESARGTVRLSLPEGLGLEILIPALGDFYRRYPDIKLVFNLSATTANFTQAEADISVRLFCPDEDQLIKRCLGEMKIGLYASKAYEKNHGLPTRLKDLRKHRVITYGDHLSILPENQWLFNHSDESQRILSSDSTVTRFKATISGAGISLQPVVMAQTNAELIPLFAAAKLPTHAVWLVYHEDIQHVSRIRAVAEFIADYLGDKLKEQSKLNT
jgi:DNA-binding transcriptional LysR family regulator